jgi:hypothetical protein
MLILVGENRYSALLCVKKATVCALNIEVAGFIVKTPIPKAKLIT